MQAGGDSLGRGGVMHEEREAESFEVYAMLAAADATTAMLDELEALLDVQEVRRLVCTHCWVQIS